LCLTYYIYFILYFSLWWS